MIGTNTLKGIALACALAAGSACAGVKKTTTDINPAMSRAPNCCPAVSVPTPVDAGEIDPVPALITTRVTPEVSRSTPLM